MLWNNVSLDKDRFELVPDFDFGLTCLEVDELMECINPGVGFLVILGVLNKEINT
jgi:hypothetical protein